MPKVGGASETLLLVEVGGGEKSNLGEESSRRLQSSKTHICSVTPDINSQAFPSIGKKKHQRVFITVLFLLVENRRMSK